MKIDIYQTVTDQIIAAIEAGCAPWVRPWRTMGRSSGGALPVNGATGRSYSGINVVMLWGAAMERGYASNAWYTYNQAQDVGGQVRRGERSNLVTFWRKITVQEDDGKGGKEEKSVPMVRTFNVFNADQIDGLPTAAPIAEPPEGAHLLIANGLNLRGGLNHGGDRACYMPALDGINMPNPAAFNDADNYVSTLLHECTHATGAGTRLARDLSGRFGSDRYAMEELVAELGSAFLCARLGVNGDMRHAAYVDNWMKVLKADKKAIFAASAAARAASEYMLKVSGINAEDEDEQSMAAK